MPNDEIIPIPEPIIENKKVNSWEAVDKRCPTCNQVTEVARGINKQNLKRLVFAKPNMTDWMMFIMICGILLLAWRYNVETAQARELLSNPGSFCSDYYNIGVDDNSLIPNNPLSELNFSNLNLTKINQTITN